MSMVSCFGVIWKRQLVMLSQVYHPLLRYRQQVSV
jgi:hypothetical protein